MDFHQIISTQVKVENQQELDHVGLCMNQQFQNKLELPSPSSYNNSLHQQNNHSQFETLCPHDQDNNANSPLFYDFNDYDDSNNVDFILLEDKYKMFHELLGNETKPLTVNETTKPLVQHCDQNPRIGTISDEVQVQEMDLFPIKNEEGNNNNNINNKGKMKSCKLEFEEIQKYFSVPISNAAKEMKIGLTVLKKRCRELNIMRWPHRKIKSLKCLINNVKEMGLSRKDIEMLEEHKRMLEKVPQTELSDRTKKLRQACFKASYKKRKSLTIASA